MIALARGQHRKRRLSLRLRLIRLDVGLEAFAGFARIWIKFQRQGLGYGLADVHDAMLDGIGIIIVRCHNCTRGEKIAQ